MAFYSYIFSANYKRYFDNLKKINKDEKWLEKELKVRNIELLDIILMYQADNNSLIIYTLNEIERNFDT